MPITSIAKSGGGYAVGYRYVPDFRRVLNTYSEQTEKLPVVQTAINALIDDADLVRQLIKAHRNNIETSRDDLKSIASFHLSKIAETVLYGSDFNPIYDSFENYLYSDSLPYVTIAPLEGFKSEIDKVVFSPSLTINRLSEREVESYYNSADFLLNTPRSSVLWISHDVRNRYDIDKGHHVNVKEQVDIVEQLVTALRLLKAGSVGVNSIWCFTTSSWLGSGASQPRPNYINYAHGQSKPYILEAKDVAILQSIWQQLREYPYEKWRSVRAALRRLNSSYERIEPEDKLLEYMIGFESILLSGAGDERERGELRFRLALHGAFFLSIEADGRRRLFRFLKKAYDERSAVVHGDTQAKAQVKVDDVAYTFPDFVAQVEDKFRTTLRKILETKSTQISEDTLFH